MKSPLDPEIKISPIREQHIEGFHRCLDEIARERKYLAFVTAPPLDSTREFVMENIKNNIPQYVALKGERLIGFCDIRPHKLEGFQHSGQLGMGVQKGFRRQGIGQRLTEITLDKARQLGLERIELEVYASNYPAVGLYKKLGFKIEGRKQNARKLDGLSDDLILMAMLFD